MSADRKPDTSRAQAGPGPGRPGSGGPGSGGPGGRFGGPRGKAKDARGTLRRLVGYVGGKKLLLVLVLILALVSSFISIVSIYFNGSVLDDFAADGNLADLIRICLLLGGMYITSTLCSYAQSRMMVSLSQDTVQVIRHDLFAHLKTLPLTYFDTHPAGDLMSRLTNDVDNISNTLSNSVSSLFTNGVLVLGVFAAMLLLSPLLTLLSMLAIPLMLYLTSTIAKHARKYFSKQQEDLGNVNGYIEEMISGQKVVKLFNRQGAVHDEFQALNLELQKSGIAAQCIGGVMGPVMNFMGNVSYVLVSIAGGWLVVQSGGSVSVGMMFSFLLYMRNFSRPLTELANLYSNFQSALAGAERVFAVMDEKPELPDKPGATDPNPMQGHIALRDVTFSYVPGTPVLNDISLEAKPGQTIALVGPTGSGKTTIASLLSRFYDVDSGSILLDGVDIRDLQRDALRSGIAIVLQDTFLFTESIMENIRYGRPGATDQEVIHASKMANCHSFVRHLSEGYDTVLSDNGANLSQGQRQLLAIARAILADPGILILDEATSSVDTRTELHIQEAMLALMKGRTSFVIAHRLNTVRNADRILVIQNGRITERGNHEELMQLDGFYAGLLKGQHSTGLALLD